MDNSESWKNQGKKPSVYPKAVCAFCQFCTGDSNTERKELQYDHEHLCRKHPTQRTIDPITGKPTRAFFKLPISSVADQYNEEEMSGSVEIEYTDEKYVYCQVFNNIGQCQDFKKLKNSKAKQFQLSIGKEKK